jgi:DNA recombination protein RmuC
MFLPGEAFFGAALDCDPALIEDAWRRNVIVASPTTLIALLRTVAQGWSHEALADQAREIHRLGRDLHDRLGTLTGHLDQVGRSLNAAVGHYNTAVGSLESRVLVAARRFTELSVVDEELGSPRQVESAARTVAPVELRRVASGED